MSAGAPSVRPDTPAAIRHVVVLGHPGGESFDHSVVRAYCETVNDCGQVAVVRDLYAMHFDPLLRAGERATRRGFTPAADGAHELELLRDAAVIAFVYPIWFGLPPAIIKGYVDRVLGAGFVGRDVMLPSQSMLHGKHMISFSSSASTRPWLAEQGQWSALRQGFDGYLATIFGLKLDDHVHFDSVVDELKPRFAAEMLETAREKVRRLCSAVLHERHEAALHRIRRPAGATADAQP